jgi:hypothetical protein
MKRTLTVVAFLLLFLPFMNVYAYSYCTNVPVKSVESANSPGFHNMSELGVVGTFLFVRLDTSNCKDSQGKPFAGTVFLVIDDLDNPTSPNNLKKSWVSMLMTAVAAGKSVNFHASNLGINSRNMQALRPYYLALH